MIATEKEHIWCKMPENVIEQLRQIKKRSLVISPDEIVSHVIFYWGDFNLSSQVLSELKEANLFVRSQYKAHIGESMNESLLRDKRRALRFSAQEEIFNLIDG